MLGCHLRSPALLVSQEFLETGGCKGKSLPTKAHQVGILKPGVAEAVLDGWTGPVDDDKEPNITNWQYFQSTADMRRIHYSAYHG